MRRFEGKYENEVRFKGRCEVEATYDGRAGEYMEARFKWKAGTKIQ